MINRLIRLLERSAAGDASAGNEFRRTLRPDLVARTQSLHPDIDAQEVEFTVDAALSRMLRTVAGNAGKRATKKTPAEVFRDDVGVRKALAKIVQELTDDLPNRRLVQKVANGDEAAFNRLHDLFEKPVKLFAKRRLFDPALADDVQVETMWFVWANGGRFKGESKVSTWIYGIANNKAMEAVREYGGNFIEIVAEDGEDAISEIDSAVVDVRASQAGDVPIVDPSDRAKLDECCHKLAGAEGACLHLWLRGEKYEDIAEIIEKPVHWVSRKIEKAMKQIYECVHGRLASNK